MSFDTTSVLRLRTKRRELQHGVTPDHTRARPKTDAFKASVRAGTAHVFGTSTAIGKFDRLCVQCGGFGFDDCFCHTPAFPVGADDGGGTECTTHLLIDNDYGYVEESTIPREFLLRMGADRYRPGQVVLEAGPAPFDLSNLEAQLGFDVREPERGDTVSLANIAGDEAIFNGGYAIVGLPIPGRPRYVLERVNYLDAGIVVGDYMCVLFGPSASVYEISTVDECHLTWLFENTNYENFALLLKLYLQCTC